MKKTIVFVIGIMLTSFVLCPVCSGAANEKEEKVKLDDDLYVEIQAQLSFAMNQVFKRYKGVEAAEKADETKEKIYKKYGVSKKELDQYIEELSEKDVARAGRLMQRVAKRSQELMSGAKKEPAPVTGTNEIKGFPGIPVYPGAESPAGTEMGDTEGAKEMLAKEGRIWYEFGKKLSSEYDKDARGVDNRIVDFYKDKLAKKGWKFIGEGVRTHHWAKGGKAVGISFPADCTIEYRHLSVEEAKGNCGQLSEDQFIKAFFTCTKAIQDTCKKQGIQSMDDYQGMMADNKALEKFNQKIEKDLNQALTSYGVTFKRFKEIKNQYNFDKMMEKLYSEHGQEMESLSLALMILTEMIQ